MQLQGLHAAFIRLTEIIGRGGGGGTTEHRSLFHLLCCFSRRVIYDVFLFAGHSRALAITAAADVLLCCDVFPSGFW